MLKKIISLFLVVAFALGVSSCSGDTKEAGEKGLSLGEINAERDSLDYEDEYTKQHLEFIAGETYEKICSDGGGLAADVAKNYEDAKLNYVNGTWKIISGASAFVDKGELKLENEYEVLVTELMQNTSAEESFSGSFQSNYYTAIVGMLNGIKAVLDDAKKAADIFTGADIEKAEKTAKKLDDIVKKLEKPEGVSDKEATGLFSDAVKQVKASFNEDFIKGNEKFLDGVKGVLGKAADVSGFVSEKADALLDEYVMYQAMAASSEEWESVWTSISANLKVSALSTSEKKLKESYEKVAACIDKILIKTGAYRSSNGAGIFLSVAEQGFETVAELSASAGKELWDGMMKSWPVGKAVREGLVKGVGLANMLMNCDDIAYYGQMLIGYGRLGECAYKTMESVANTLKSKKDYDSALMFDKAFNIYKSIQMAASDCTISYCMAIVDNPMGYIFKYTSDDEIAETFIIQVYKAEWIPIRCHGVQNVINNGGNVVGYGGNVYYFKLSSSSLGDTGTYGNFTVDGNVKNSLVCRNASGEEKVITQTNATGGIYICADRLYYRKQDYDWYSVSFNGDDERVATTGTIIGAADSQGMLIVKTEDNDIYATDFSGNQINLLPKDYVGITEKHECYYNYTSDDAGYTFCRYSFATKQNELLCSAIVPQGNGSWRVLDDICVSDDGIYFLVGYYAGTGNFFQEGKIYFLSFATNQVTLLVDKDISYSKMYLAEEDGKKYLYYYNTGGVLGVGLFTGCMDSEVCRLDLATGETAMVSFPLCGEGIAFINGTSLQILQNGKNSPTTIINDTMLKGMGYTASLGFAEDGSAVYHEWAEQIEDTYYVSLMQVVEDESTTLGWRQGYRRISTKMYSISDDGKDIELICEY